MTSGSLMCCETTSLHNPAKQRCSLCARTEPFRQHADRLADQWRGPVSEQRAADDTHGTQCSEAKIGGFYIVCRRKPADLVGDIFDRAGSRLRSAPPIGE